MKIDKKQMLDRYQRGLGSDGKTRILYLRYAGDFLDYSNGSFDRQVISKHLDRLRKKFHYSDGTINFIFRIIRTLYSRNSGLLEAEGIEWPFRRGETPQIREKNVKAPALHPRTVERMVAAAREHNNIDETAFLALSTTYGLRQVEMMELENKDIKLKDRVIHIATAKHGRERSHMIPKEIIPYLERYDFDQSISEFKMLSIWYLLEYRIKLRHIERVGWHSIRRTLNTLLAKELSEITVKSFLRHKQRTSSDMTFRYSAITFVGEEEEMTELSSDSSAADQEVFDIHPFIGFWK